MRILVTTTGFPGHFLPLVPFARAWARAGHEVCVAGPRAAAATAERAGLQFCPCADLPEQETGKLMASVAGLAHEDGHARMIAEGFAGLVARTALGDLLRLTAAWRPDLVVRESQELAGALAAERHGVPHARIALGLASTEEETLALVAEPIDELRAVLGLQPDPGASRLRAEPCLTLVPPALDGPGAPVAHRFREAAAAPAPLPDWWPGNRDPLVYATFGSMAGSLGFFPEIYLGVAETLAGLPVRVLLTTGLDADPARLAPLPKNVHAERWVDQASALTDAVAVVCHGGYGTMLGALARGKPLAVMPLFAGDQWHNARRLWEIGAGIALVGETATPRKMFEPPDLDVFASLPGAVRRLVDEPGHAAAAGQIAADAAALPPVEAAAAALGEVMLPPAGAAA
jgi:UDP:flavonoid glycosyltransferase YjiC (YdhE family)